ncbi:hypothetical protein, partial [Planococcus soli]|uniref:hypothetical protein n=1 Tax=Planococcus soli TaxID=2666072 RepID=UPI001C8F46EE
YKRRESLAKFNQWLSSMHSLASFSAIGGSKLRTSGFFVPQYSLLSIEFKTITFLSFVELLDGISL